MLQPFHNRDVAISHKTHEQTRDERRVFVKIYNSKCAKESDDTKFIPEFAFTLFCCTSTVKSVNTL